MQLSYNNYHYLIISDYVAKILGFLRGHEVVLDQSTQRPAGVRTCRSFATLVSDHFGPGNSDLLHCTFSSVFSTGSLQSCAIVSTESLQPYTLSCTVRPFVAIFNWNDPQLNTSYLCRLVWRTLQNKKVFCWLSKRFTGCPQESFQRFRDFTNQGGRVIYKKPTEGFQVII